MNKVAISQSNYIPWKGYFDLIAHVDQFILFDDMQYTRRDWRNRNKIKTPQGLNWLTIPVKVKGKYFQKINETLVDGHNWKTNHLKQIEINYRKAEYFHEVYSLLEPLYLENKTEYLSEINKSFIIKINEYLGIETKILTSDQFDLLKDKNERLIKLCKEVNAEVYVTSPAAKVYLDESQFINENIIVEWFDYDGYLTYPQLWGQFEHFVSVIDLLFNCGKNSINYFKRN